MLRELRASVVSVLVFTILTGFLFPAVITGIARAVFPSQANGSLVTAGGKVVGSRLIGQAFTAPGYFHPRPSAAGDGYDAAASGGTNLGPTSKKLIHGDAAEGLMGVEQLAAAYRTENGLAADAPLPSDAVTRSGSGLDPHISPANAALQVRRVAQARGIGEDAVRQMVAANTEGRQFGFLGEPRVNVLMLNLALDRAARGSVAPARSARRQGETE